MQESAVSVPFHPFQTVADPVLGRPARSDFKVRLLSSLVLAPTAVFLAWLGGFWFAGLMGLVAALMYWEWAVMTRRSIDIRRDLAAGFCILLLILSMTAAPSIFLVILSFALIAAGWVMVAVFKTVLGWNVAGTGIASGLALCLIYLRFVADTPDNSEDYGFSLLIFLGFSVWAADIFAYLTGRSLGGPKLMPKVSPKKTWSGFIGGLLGAVFTGAFVALAAFPGVYPDRLATFMFAALTLALAAQAGDLIESAVKRHFNVKDASNLIPGHGGILDRVDGLTLAAYAFVLIYAIGVISNQQ